MADPHGDGSSASRVALAAHQSCCRQGRLARQAEVEDAVDKSSNIDESKAGMDEIHIDLIQINSDGVCVAAPDGGGNDGDDDLSQSNCVWRIWAGQPETKRDVKVDERNFVVSAELQALLEELKGDSAECELVGDSSNLPYKLGDGRDGEDQIEDMAVVDLKWGFFQTEMPRLLALSPREFRWLRRRLPDLGLTRVRPLLAVLLHHGLQEQADFLLRSGGADFCTSWWASVFNGYRGTSRLLQLGADPNRLCAWELGWRAYPLQCQQYWSPFAEVEGETQEQAIQRYEGLVRVLLDHQADPNLTCGDGEGDSEPPLKLARTPTIARMLLEARGTIKDPDDEREAPEFVKDLLHRAKQQQ